MKSKAMNKYVTFKLGDTRFGVAVLKTREIVEYGKITPVPEAPEYIEGVINLRGSVVPVVNLSKKFFGVENQIKETTSIMIVEPEIDGDQTKMGLIVDVTSYDNEFILILDIDKVMSQIDFSNDFVVSQEQSEKK